jgi:DNA-binding NarL/FixJ family response regulator
MNTKVRVLVANRPRLMRDLILETIGGLPDIEVAGEIQEESEILEAVERTQPDFLIVALGDSDERPQICDSVLARHPEVRVLAIAPDRNSTIYYWVSPVIHSAPIETSEGGVLSALRSRMNHRGR